MGIAISAAMSFICQYIADGTIIPTVSGTLMISHPASWAALKTFIRYSGSVLVASIAEKTHFSPWSFMYWTASTASWMTSSWLFLIVYTRCTSCLLYTSDAADDLLCVDLGGRRIIKKKNT